MKAQALSDTSIMGYMTAKKHLEINPDHWIIKTMKAKVNQDKNDKSVKIWSLYYMNTLLLASGFTLETSEENSAETFRMEEVD